MYIDITNAVNALVHVKDGNWMVGRAGNVIIKLAGIIESTGDT